MFYTAHHYQWKNRKLKDNTYPIKLVVNINGKRKNYKTDFSYTKADWEKLNGSKLRDQDLKVAKEQLSDKVKEVKAILASIAFPNFQSFEKIYNQKRLKNDQSVSHWFDAYYSLLKSQNKPYSSLRLLNTAKNSFESHKKNINFQDVTRKFLDDYETSMINIEKVTQTTVGIYITRLRIIFNYAIAEGIIPRDLYPFGKQLGGYVIKSSQARKPALTLTQVESLSLFDCEDMEIEFARDIWILLYLLNGSNILDLCRLRFENIDFNEKSFFYKRTKTRGTITINKNITGGLHPNAERIILKYCNQDKSPDMYVFPFLNELKGDEINHLHDEYNIKTDLLKRINRDLKPFKDKLNISFNLTVKIARHTFASVLHYDLKYSIAEVGQAMNHSNSSVTDSYLSGMDIAQQKKMNFGLLNIEPNKKMK